MGVGIHVRDFTRASQTAITNALWHTSRYFVNSIGAGAQSIRVDVTIAVPDPDAANGQALLNMPLNGQGHINVAKGARSPERKRSDVTIISNAAGMVNLDV